MRETGRIGRWLDAGFRVPGAFQAQQAAVVRARMAALAPVIAGLTLAWTPVDAYGLAVDELARILPLRMLLALALAAVWWLRDRLSAHAAIAAFVWAQAAGFGAMLLALDSSDGPLRLGYGLFPFVIAAQLAVFPMPWGRSLRIALAALALLLAPVLLGHRPADGVLVNNLWLLALIVAMAAWGAHTQLRLLVDLLGARQDASCDGLTGLANRRAADERLAVEHARALRLGEPLSVAMLDLDHFKRVNDTHGHATGDRVLAAAAQVLREELRGADLGARYGGEEFIALLPATGPAQALQVAERIRARIARLEVPAESGPVHVTASLGLATLREGEEPAATVARADAALYRAKAGGRDRCVSDDAVPPVPSVAATTG